LLNIQLAFSQGGFALLPLASSIAIAAQCYYLTTLTANSIDHFHCPQQPVPQAQSQ